MITADLNGIIIEIYICTPGYKIYYKIMIQNFVIFFIIGTDF